MDAFSIYPGKTIPLIISAFLTYRIYKCPCDELMKCTRSSSLFLLGTLFFMTIIGWPSK